jgi:hypothetical protein
MSKLYTSLVHLKMEMNGGTLPPMMPVPESVHGIIDPAFTIGLGALEEHPVKGLRCPVRGCGKYYQTLTKHLNYKHGEIGGERAIKRALSIPATAKLTSLRSRQRYGDVARRHRMADGLHPNFRGVTGTARVKHKTTRRSVSLTVGARNLRNQCERQLQHKLLDLQSQLGRSPSARDAISVYGAGFVSAVARVFGSWDAAKAQIQIPLRKGSPKLRPIEVVLPALMEWYRVHGELPSATAIHRGTRLPVLPGERSILRAFNTDSWPHAMKVAASLLDIYGGKYGLPIEHKPVEENAA